MDITAPQSVENRSLMSLFKDLWRETSTLVHEEAELAKAELSEKASQVSTGVAAVAIGGAIVFSGFLVLLGAAVGALYLMLDTEHRIWLAPLIVGLAVVVIGFIALAMGRRELKAGNLAPTRTMDSMRQNAELVKGHVQ
jgi:apolipoprotein N-acyltransferase